MELRPELLGKGAPGWALRGASLDMDFANGRYFGGGGVGLSALLTTTRASTKWVQPANAAAAWFNVANNVAGISDLGLGVHQAATTLANKSRRLDDGAQWTLTNITASAVQGIDLVAASATRLTATGANATCLGIANTQASSACRAAPFVRRIAGTGNIDVTLDNGSTWTTLVGMTGSFTRLGVGQTLANPKLGIRIVSSGDVVDVDFFNGETTSFDTPPIESLSASATRAADSIVLAGAAATAAIAPIGWVYAKLPFGSNNTGGQHAHILIRNQSPFDAPITANSSTTLRSEINSSGATQATIGGSGTWASAVTAVSTWDGTGISNVANGGTVAVGATPFSASSSVSGQYLGSADGATAGEFVSNIISRLTIGTGTKLSSAQAQALSAQ